MGANVGKLAFFLIFMPLIIGGLICWFWIYCWRKNEENGAIATSQQHPRIVSSPRSLHENQNRFASYSPYSPRSSQIGFGLDTNEIASSNGHVAPYRPYPSNEALSPTEAGYLLAHPTVPYPLPDSSSLPSSADQPPPSYAEVMRNS